MPSDRRESCNCIRILKINHSLLPVIVYHWPSEYIPGTYSGPWSLCVLHFQPGYATKCWNGLLHLYLAPKDEKHHTITWFHPSFTITETFCFFNSRLLSNTFLTKIPKQINFLSSENMNFSQSSLFRYFITKARRFVRFISPWSVVDFEAPYLRNQAISDCFLTNLVTIWCINHISQVIRNYFCNFYGLIFFNNLEIQLLGT